MYKSLCDQFTDIRPYSMIVARSLAHDYFTLKNLQLNDIKFYCTFLWKMYILVFQCLRSSSMIRVLTLPLGWAAIRSEEGGV